MGVRRAGLYAHEKRLVAPLVFASSALFLIGMSFAYFLVFPGVFKFMASIAPEGVAWMTDIDKYLSFASPLRRVRCDRSRSRSR